MSLAASYSCRGKASTTISAGELNCCVRYGNRCDLSAIAARLILDSCPLMKGKDYYKHFTSKMQP